MFWALTAAIYFTIESSNFLFLFSVKSVGATIPLQSLLDKTIARLMEFVEVSSAISQVTLICKWGCDGSSGYSDFMYKPNKEESLASEDEGASTEEYEKEDIEINVSMQNLFIMSLVPLRLIKTDDEKTILWENPRPSSTQWCRCIRMLYMKETPRLIMQEVRSIEREIKNLKPYNSGELICHYQLCLTMLNGEAISAITKVPSQVCHICKAKPTQMNNMDNTQFKNVNINDLKYGLTTMHAWIKAMELILHLGYYLKLKKPTIRNATTAEKDEIERRKADIKAKLKEQLGLHIDKIIQGRGTSNTGNVGRKFLKNYKIVSKITGVYEKLIEKLYFIMITLSCGEEINLDAFKLFARETAELYVSKYNWYRLPVSIHKILMHGAETAKELILPISLMSEESQESCNKLYRRIRERHTRKNTLLHMTEDVIRTMMLQSDPILSNIRLTSYNRKTKKIHELPEEVRSLINIKILESEEEEDYDDDDDDDF